MTSYQCSGSASGSVGSVCFWASQIRIRIRYLEVRIRGSGSDQNVADPQHWAKSGCGFAEPYSVNRYGSATSIQKYGAHATRGGARQQQGKSPPLDLAKYRVGNGISFRKNSAE
jgi:hypothetical protein